ncbi:HNH endonuclease signature motif containing protein [Streptomyces bathyalis]|uniref:HNH endonuclease signature motif containing protein n=1 Tax=Streptomyces bathyalis TaxID=2710756 RepID=UPI003CCDBF9B
MIQIPNEQALPPGAHRYLLLKLHEIYKRAGFPGIKSISNATIHLGDNCDIVSHQGVSNILSGKSTPRWSKLEALVLVLASLDVTRPDPRKLAQTFHELWLPLVSEPPIDLAPPRPGDGHHASEETTKTPHSSAPISNSRKTATPRGGRVIATRLKQDLRLEVGGKCPVSNCQSTTIELAHITPMRAGGENVFGNLIFLCPNHHRQYDTGGFSEQEVRLIKARLAWNNDRYTHAELVWLWVFAKNGGTHFIHPSSEHECLRFLEADGYITMDKSGEENSEGPTDTWHLTELGVRFAEVWGDSGAHPIDIR